MTTKIKAPTLSANLDTLMNGGLKIKSRKKQDKPFTIEGVQQIFNDYEKNTSSPSVKSAINNIKIEILGSDIQILSPIQIYLDFIRQERTLIDILHESYSDSYDKILYKVSEATFPDYSPPKKPKHLTTSEKFDLLTLKNPQFKNLVDTFKLTVINN